MIADKIQQYNYEYVHSALGYLSPEEFIQKWIQQNISSGYDKKVFCWF